MPSFSLHTLPFWLHSAVEFIPAVVFFINPSAQLYTNLNNARPELPWSAGCDNCPIKLKPGVDALIRQYAVLLFVSVLISASFTMASPNITSRRVAMALAIYHCAPIVRSSLRLRAGETALHAKDIGGPWVHLAVHSLCLLALGSLALGILDHERDLKDRSRQSKRS